MANRIYRHTAVISLCTALSRALGLLRNILMARMFGTSLVQSAFVLAFRLPNLFRRLFGEGALSAAFVPVFTETLEKEGREAARALAGKVVTMLATTLGMIVLGALAVATVVLQSEHLDEVSSTFLPLFRIMFPYMFFICMVAACMAILNSLHHFFIPAFTPVILNVVWIGALVFLCPRFGDLPEERIYGAAWGILAAGGIQLFIQVPILIKRRMLPRLSFSWKDPRVAMVLLAMGPAALGMGVFQVNVLIDSLLAFVVGDWAPAALSFAELLVYLPLGVFATALGTVLLPTFSRQAARAREEDIRTTVGHALSNLLAIMIPASVGLAVLAGPIVRLLYEGDKFDANSTLLTARALVFYAPGLVAFGAYKVLVPAFYALKDTRTPVRVGLWMVGLNLGLNILFIITWAPMYRHAGLAFATVLSSSINGIVLARILHQRVGSPGWARIGKRTVKILIGAGIMGVVVFWAHGWLSETFVQKGVVAKGGQALALGGAIVAGVAIYAAAWVLSREPERSA